MRRFRPLRIQSARQSILHRVCRSRQPARPWRRHAVPQRPDRLDLVPAPAAAGADVLASRAPPRSYGELRGSRSRKPASRRGRSAVARRHDDRFHRQRSRLLVTGWRHARHRRAGRYSAPARRALQRPHRCFAARQWLQLRGPGPARHPRDHPRLQRLRGAVPYGRRQGGRQARPCLPRETPGAPRGRPGPHAFREGAAACGDQGRGGRTRPRQGHEEDGARLGHGRGEPRRDQVGIGQDGRRQGGRRQEGRRGQGRAGETGQGRQARGAGTQEGRPGRRRSDADGQPAARGDDRQRSRQP